MSDDDPRLDPEFVRRVDDDVVIVGVVHDHPSSVSRVRHVVDAADPDVLALELAPTAVPLFEAYAQDDRTPPSFGGEMSAAAQAAETDRIVGVDGPSTGFAARLARTLSAEDASRGTVRGALGRLATSAKRAIVCRLAAIVAARWSLRVEVDAPVEHDVSYEDDPGTQADDERVQVRRARAITRAFEPPAASRVCNSAREEHMADRLAELRTEGDVVAVVGIDHLDPVVERLECPYCGP